MSSDPNPRRHGGSELSPGVRKSSTEHRLARHASLVEIGKALSANLEMEPLLRTVHEQIGRVLDARNFYVAICEEATDEWVAVYDIEHGETMPSGERHPIHSGLTGHIIRTRSSLIFHTPDELAAFTGQEGVTPIGEQPVSWMGVPLIAGDRIVGVMGIQSYDQKIAYTTGDLDFFSTAGTQVAIAVQNAQLFKASSDRVTRLSILLEISRAVSMDLDLDSILTTVYREVGRVFNTKNFYIATHEKGSDAWDWTFHVEGGERQPPTRHSLSAGLTGYILRTGRSLMFHSPKELLAFTEREGVVVLDRPPVSWMGMPLIARDHISGVITIQSYEQENAYNEADIALFSAIASLVASAVRNAQLYLEVADRNRKLEAANLELGNTQLKLLQAQKLEAIGQLAAGIAHEINTPIQFIGDNTRFFGEAITSLKQVLARYDEILGSDQNGTSLNAQMIAKLHKDYDLEFVLAELPAAVDQTLDGVNRVSTIVQALKAFSHPDARERVHTDLNAALQNTTVVCRNEWKYVADLNLDLDAQLPLIPCFPGDMNQVFMNLIVNAAHAIQDKVGNSGEKGVIEISTRMEEGYAVIRVRDSGTGIRQGHLARIFEPFYTTKEVGRGTGQGLAISRNIVVGKHGGKLEAESDVGMGSTFIIHLPIGGT